MVAPKLPCIPETAPFTAEQRLWLNGFLAGLFSAAEASAPSAPVSAIPLLILFGSQTGSAQGLAKRIAQEANTRGCRPRVVDAAAHATIDWKQESNLFVVTSTYGDGDMPDNAQEFWQWLQTDAGRALAHLRYSVLALGDQNYPEFCAAGRKLDARLEELGAQRIHPRADCDVDYEAPAGAWTQGALAAVAAEPKPESRIEAKATTAESAPSAKASGPRARCRPVRLVANRLLNGEGSVKETRHLEFSLADSGLLYEPGDAFGVYPANCPAAVDELLTALGCDGEEAVLTPEGEEVPLRKALRESYDLVKPTPELLRVAGEKSPALRDLLAPGREAALKNWLWGRHIADVLGCAPDLRLAPAEFVALLRKLAPRLYSISSSPKAHGDQIHLTANVLRYESLGRRRKGVCSTFLAERVAPESLVHAFIQSSPKFHLPPPDAPLIMVGPGTGVAPFRGFLHERQATAARGPNWLFFGEQRAATDFYYREEWERMVDEGLLTRLSTAFSRDQQDKVYVQHRMLEQAGELWAWLQDGAHFYVCGDASRMAKDVDAALRSVAQKAGGLTAAAAEEFVLQFNHEQRYHRDVY